MKNLIFPGLLTLVLVGPVLGGCSDEDAKPAVSLGDAATGDADAGTPPVGSNACSTYCSNVTANCTGDNIQYKDNADCLSYCNSAKWPAGIPDEMAGNTLACRIYHSGVAKTNPVLHCPHGGPTGAGVCGKITTRSDAVAAYTRVDRMGMPAVATALVGDSVRKTAFNDGNPANDVKDFLMDWGTRLKFFHDNLDDDLAKLMLTPCSLMPAMAGGTLPACLTQEYAPGKTVASLIAPSDVIRVNPAAAAGFPNGRKLEDPVIDVTLAVLLLDLSKHPADTLAKVPLNPSKNDVTNLTTFPYLAPAQTQ